MKYLVWAKDSTYYCLEVDAEDEDEAWEIAENTHPNEFCPTKDGDWEVVTCDPAD